jgi:hypothetical protein
MAKKLPVSSSVLDPDSLSPGPVTTFSAECQPDPDPIRNQGFDDQKLEINARFCVCNFKLARVGKIESGNTEGRAGNCRPRYIQ